MKATTRFEFQKSQALQIGLKAITTSEKQNVMTSDSQEDELSKKLISAYVFTPLVSVLGFTKLLTPRKDLIRSNLFKWDLMYGRGLIYNHRVSIFFLSTCRFEMIHDYAR